MDTPTYKKIPFIYVGPGEVMSAGIVLPLVCATVVGLRFYTRKSQKVALGLDDWLTIPSLIMIFALGICFIVGVAKDVYGYRTVLPSDITPENQTTKVIPSYTIEAKIEFWFQLFLILAYGFIKLSILCFIRRIFNVTKGTIFNVISTAMLAMTVMWTIGFFLLFLFGCKSKVWAHWAPLAQFTEYCGNGLAAEMALIISDFITDVMIFLLPLPMVNLEPAHDYFEET
ncbi:hypothetical protein HYFRA_00004961 [Hymenoscyphus fraxineus]|uniref:Rhodopsin domain-containing protein n=1 Tax=Hymenoscyphus fraxineus TaxID=746836 RepID=A0A9N9KNQ2_9HELO|nr:hypothetical protein HYFRA_00004961 [Hymenoscyphus fraxineus]